MPDICEDFSVSSVRSGTFSRAIGAVPLRISHIAATLRPGVHPLRRECAMRRPKASYANVMATVAVLIAAGGGAAIATADDATQVFACVRNDGETGAGRVL